ncbi:hypothetical protein A6E15_00960 [Natrinema saccharevitans]|uniref:Uncharacterized protein n=1 Tax=Natrinema saccharevitans TaxID=301967 RepID=A0A1S8AT07_9EURY|nr:hypothetical protein [Natrinema saccharevitans]OLZ39639.1 hypothetical protein A6E15_00960 [Natrinema saccharevitans]
MVLRCSLLGHDFGEAEVEREREERGSEVVVTVQEYEECARCGERNVISENTEVTSLSAETDADAPPAEPDTEPPEPALASDPDPTDGPDDAEFIDADEPATAAADPTAAEPADADADDPAAPDLEEAEPDPGTLDLPTDENGEPVTDDGEILEDDEPAADPDRDRERGEWPDSDDVGPPADEPSEPADWPDDGSADADDAADAGTGVDPAAIEDDAVLLDDEPADPVDGPETGEAAADARSVTAEPPTQDATEPAADVASEPGTGIERAESVPTPVEGDSGPGEDVPTEFYCPRCEYVAAGDRGSLRAGDICPDCRKGYLSERERR